MSGPDVVIHTSYYLLYTQQQKSYGSLWKNKINLLQ
jgi:hypothetical protein